MRSFGPIGSNFKFKSIYSGVFSLTHFSGD